MVRISKLADYGVAMMAFMAIDPTRLFQAREIAEATKIAMPTVAKLLKRLVKYQLLISQRGVNGGYQLREHPHAITMADLIYALEGPIAITECSLGHDHCATEHACNVKTPWQKINHIIKNALQAIKLSDLVDTYPLKVKHYV